MNSNLKAKRFEATSVYASPVTGATEPPTLSPRKKKSSNAIGNEAELIAQAWLIEQGYKVHRAVRAFRPVGGGRLINFQTDVFGCIDLVAKKPGSRTRWVQVTVDGGIGRKQSDLSVVPWNLNCDDVEIWQWKKRKKVKGMTNAEYQKWLYFRVQSLSGAGWVEDRDIRPFDLPDVKPSSLTPGATV